MKTILMTALVSVLLSSNASANSKHESTLGNDIVNISTGGPSLTSFGLLFTTGSPVFAKEIIMNVKGDAQDYLAGEQPTGALISAIAELRSLNISEINKLTDEELVIEIALAKIN